MYFTEEELRDLPQMENTDRYTEARITRAREWIESIIERKVGTSFELRTSTETFDGDRANSMVGIILSRPYARAVTSLVSNGTTFSVDQLAALSIRDGVLIQRAAGWYTATAPWDPGRRNIVVTYTSAYSTIPPSDIKEAALTAARDWLLRRYGNQGVSDRAVSLQTEMGNTVFATANDLFRPTGIPDVDATIMGWANRIDLGGFA